MANAISWMFVETKFITKQQYDAWSFAVEFCSLKQNFHKTTYVFEALLCSDLALFW